MHGIFIALLLAVELAALGVLIAIGLRALRGPDPSRCPGCGHDAAPRDAVPCTECGLERPAALAVRRRRLRIGAVAATVVLAVFAFAATIAIEGISRVPSWFLVRWADPLGDPGSFGHRAAFELLERQTRGSLDPRDLDAILIRGLDDAIDRGQLFLVRSTWPLDEPVRIALDRSTLSSLRSNAPTELVLVAPDGSERAATSWGGIGRDFAQPGETWAWRDRTIELPAAARGEDGLRFEVLLRREDGSILHRRSVALPLAVGDGGVQPFEDDAAWAALVEKVRIRWSPVPRETVPDARVILWFEPSLGATLAQRRGVSIALEVAVEGIDDPSFRASGAVLVRSDSVLITPSQTAPLAMPATSDAPPGRVRVVLRASPTWALRDFGRSKRLVGERSFEIEMSDVGR
jgi:hypothetical protein